MEKDRIVLVFFLSPTRTAFWALLASPDGWSGTMIFYLGQTGPVLMKLGDAISVNPKL
jgi:hypothetical protein